MNGNTALMGEEFSKFPLKKRRFLERYAETGSVNLASQHAGVSRRTHLKWKNKDKAFALAHEDALTTAVELMEHEARRRAIEGTLEPVYYQGRAVGAVRKYSDLLLIFLLKAARPEKYRDTHPSFAEPPRATREENLNEIQRELARLAACNGAGQHPQQPDEQPPSAICS